MGRHMGKASDYVRVEYDGNKYYVPRPPALSWVWWLLAGLFACSLALMVASLVIGRLS